MAPDPTLRAARRRTVLALAATLAGARATAATGQASASGAAGAAAGARPVAPAVIAARYRESFADDFDDDDLGRFNEDGRPGRGQAPAWRSRMRHPRKDVVNQEKQIYVDPAYAGLGGEALGLQPFSLADGVLRVTARPVPSPEVREALHGMHFTSGCISSEFGHAQRYGYFEMRARLPRGRGFWPAFWLLPVRAAWPPEIDIMEANGARPGALHFSVRDPHDTTGRGSGWRQLPPGAGGWQVFGCEWTAERVRFVVDGRLAWEVRGHGVHEPMYMIANLALGSHDANWIPDPDASTPFPSSLEIDYIRAFART